VKHDTKTLVEAGAGALVAIIAVWLTISAAVRRHAEKKRLKKKKKSAQLQISARARTDEPVRPTPRPVPEPRVEHRERPPEPVGEAAPAPTVVDSFWEQPAAVDSVPAAASVPDVAIPAGMTAVRIVDSTAPNIPAEQTNTTMLLAPGIVDSPVSAAPTPSAPATSSSAPVEELDSAATLTEVEPVAEPAVASTLRSSLVEEGPEPVVARNLAEPVTVDAESIVFSDSPQVPDVDKSVPSITRDEFDSTAGEPAETPGAPAVVEVVESFLSVTSTNLAEPLHVPESPAGVPLEDSGPEPATRHLVQADQGSTAKEIALTEGTDSESFQLLDEDKLPPSREVTYDVLVLDDSDDADDDLDSDVLGRTPIIDEGDENETIRIHVKIAENQVSGITIIGSGTAANKWGPNESGEVNGGSPKPKKGKKKKSTNRRFDAPAE
jgi:hypothetical protein